MLIEYFRLDNRNIELLDKKSCSFETELSKTFKVIAHQTHQVTNGSKNFGSTLERLLIYNLLALQGLILEKLHHFTNGVA
jgi:hypothetical protein